LTTPLPPATLTLLEKTAVDNGFDRELPRQGDWAGFASTRVPLRVWLGAAGEAGLVAAVSQVNVGRALADHGQLFVGRLPDGAVAARVVPDVPALHRLVRRAFQLSRTVGDDGAVMVSSLLDSDARRILGFDAPLRIRLLEDAHRAYLP
jgi:hypothetical protein